MCELTLCNLNNKQLNFLMGMLTTRIGSKKHDDGTGFMTADLDWKTEITAEKLSNLGHIFGKTLSLKSKSKSTTVAFHIRSATSGIPVSLENAHPFKGKNFTLMHNGSLNPTETSSAKDLKIDSDSMKFLEILDKVREQKKDASFVEVLNTAMEEFTGKFAFLIRDDKDSSFYVVRGRTAELYKAFFYTVNKDTKEEEVKDKEPNGYVINTSKETLEASILQFKNVYELYNYGTRAIFTTPTLLEQESIFLVEPLDLKKIGSVVEKTPPAKVHNQHSSANENLSIAVHKGNRHQETIGNKDLDTQVKEALALSGRLGEWSKKYSFSPFDIQILFAMIYGESLLEVSAVTVRSFMKEVIPLINAEKKFADRVHTFLNGKPFPFHLYKDKNLDYPWTLNKKEKIIEALGMPKK